LEIHTTASAHTPGPWQINRGADGELQIYTLVGQSPTVIADLFGYDPDSTEEYEANARLMAAAPDLLERCRMSLQDARDALDGEWKPTPEGWQSIIDDLEAVLAKATGR
jgi:hypothetical protein